MKQNNNTIKNNIRRIDDNTKNKKSQNMNSDSLLDKIKSIYVIKEMFEYIPADIVLNLFIHSKKHQKKFDLNRLYYLTIFMRKKEIDIKYYLNQKVYNNSDKIKLNQKFKEDCKIFKNNKNIFNSFIISFFNELSKIKEDNDKLSINIFSPFFDILSKSKFFGKLFYITNELDDIKKFNLKQKYISAFKQLNNVGSNYSSLDFSIDERDDINLLKEFKINFGQIKELSNIFIFSKNDSNNILENLFSLDNIGKNLISLGLTLSISHKIEANTFEKINNFKLLEKLQLNGFFLNKTGYLNLQNLKELFLSNCHPLSFKDVNFSKIKQLSLYNLDDLFIPNKLNLPELEKLEIGNDIKKRSFDIIDFKSLKKIKVLTDDPGYYIYPGYYNNGIKDIPNDEDITFLNNILLLKNIEEINFDIYKINNVKLLKIEGENFSLKKLKLNWFSENDKCILYNFQNKFPNLSTLILDFKLCKTKKNSISLELKEKDNCKINKISIIDLKIDTEFSCCLYKNLENITIKVSKEHIINNYKEILPIFKNDNKVIFKSLNKLHFIQTYPEINNDIFKAIYDNLDNMPNLKNLKLQFNLKILEREMYEKFIRKIISLQVNKIKIYYRYDEKSNFEYYLADDFKKLKCEVNYDYDKIYIQKYNRKNFNQK